MRRASLPQSTVDRSFNNIEVQNRIVTQIEREQALVKANRKLVVLFERKIKERMARVWRE